MLTWRIQTMYRFKMRVPQVQLLHIVVHHRDKLRLPSGDVIRQRHTGIITGINN